jgi:hypothetical protein
MTTRLRTAWIALAATVTMGLVATMATAIEYGLVAGITFNVLD